jgi:DNA invertase Pin-like site-specific DNA recombinase
LDRLSRSVRDAVALLDHSAKHGWRVLTLDLAIDTTTPFGEAMVAVSAAFAQLEGRLIGERTWAALAVTKAQGTRLGRESLLLRTSRSASSQSTNGVRVGRPLPACSTRKVATTYGGRRWYASTVRGIALRTRQPEPKTAEDLSTAKAGSRTVAS